MAKIVLNDSCLSQFGSANSDEQNLITMEKEAFLELINRYYIEVKESTGLVDGYAPFCKHLFVSNFTQLTTSTACITSENAHLLQTCYESRYPLELPVLTRHFNKASIPVEWASHLDLILYSKAQIELENCAMGTEDLNKDIDYDYGIVWIKPQSVTFEQPMDPITMMRNALGKEEGGSGVPLDREKYA